MINMALSMFHFQNMKVEADGFFLGTGHREQPWTEWWPCPYKVILRQNVAGEQVNEHFQKNKNKRWFTTVFF